MWVVTFRSAPGQPYFVPVDYNTYDLGRALHQVKVGVESFGCIVNLKRVGSL